MTVMIESHARRDASTSGFVTIDQSDDLLVRRKVAKRPLAEAAWIASGAAGASSPRFLYSLTESAKTTVRGSSVTITAKPARLSLKAAGQAVLLRMKKLDSEIQRVRTEEAAIEDAMWSE